MHILFIIFNEMNKGVYDMPLQNTSNRNKRMQQYNPTICLQQLDTLVDNQMQNLQRQKLSNYKYDLPCQRSTDLFVEINKKMQNRPLYIKNIYTDIVRSTSKNKNTQPSKIKNVNNQNNQNAQNIRARVSSIYEKLLEESKTKQAEKPSPIITDATFKPKELKKSISNLLDRHHQSTQTLNKKNTHQKNTHSHISNSKKVIQHAKRLDFASGVKTKYQKILEQHFQNIQPPKQNQFLTANQIRLSKICGKNSTIMKLKQRLQPQFSTDASKRQKFQTKEKLETKQKIKRSQLIYTFPKQPNSIMNHSKYDKKQNSLQKREKANETKVIEKKLKRSDSQRWMSMNFYQRQEKVLQNRKQKQMKGKQKQIQKQISPCTFKPQILSKNKSHKILQPQKNSYLQYYYQKLYRKY